MKKLFLLSLFFVSNAHAGYFGDMQRNTPSIHKGAVDHLFPGGRSSSAASPNSTGTSIVTQGTQRVAGTDIPINMKSDYTRGAISAAAVAAAALCGSNPLTAIICGAAIQYGLDKGIKKCEEYGWCKTENDYPTGSGWQYTGGGKVADSPAGVCSQMTFTNMNTGEEEVQIYAAGGSEVGDYGYCYRSTNPDILHISIARYCPAGVVCGGEPQLVKKPSLPPWQEPGFPPYLDGRQGQEPEFGPKIAGEATESGHPPQSSPSGGPTVSATPTTGAPKTSTSTSTRPDGSVDTTTTTTTTTVTPTVTNNNTSNPTITYNTSNNTSTSVTNNVTNQTTITNTTTNSPNEKPDLELPNDYNKEATQQQIRDEMEGKNAPAAPADQADRTKTEIGKTDTSLKDLFEGLPDKFTSDKENWFSWVWTPPVGVCNASDYSGTVRGYAVNWDICPTVSKVREVLGWLFAILGAYLIYGQIFKGNKS